MIVLLLEPWQVYSFVFPTQAEATACSTLEASTELLCEVGTELRHTARRDAQLVEQATALLAHSERPRVETLLE